MFTLTDIDGLDSDALLDVGSLGGVADLVGEDLGLAKGVHEGGATGTRGTCRAEEMSQIANTLVALCCAAKARAGLEDTHRRP